MKLVRDNIINGPGSLILPILALIFVLSVSFHNHGIAQESGHVVEISETEPDLHHSAEDCSACLLQGKVKPLDLGAGLDSLIPLIISALEETEYSVPPSFFKQDKPSRSPPVV